MYGPHHAVLAVAQTPHDDAIHKEAHMDFETILYETDGAKARITLNRPEKLNALSTQLQRELNGALWEADNDANIHVIILRGAGGLSVAFVDGEIAIVDGLPLGRLGPGKHDA